MKRIIITGNLGRDPEKRADPEGNSYATFSVGVAIGSKQKPKTDWVDVSCKDKLAEIVCAHLKKGAKVLVSGFPSVNAYINKENVAVGILRIYADDIEFMSSKDATSGGGEDVYPLPYVDNMKKQTATLNSDNIPF